ncbi:DUF5979 domain-containing protein [Microbacterium sp. 2216-1]|uniref:DUF5979 domain-containing protein n=1 Tax=Microbacterium sp. 2216-1 TaxID=3390053 RepID=UPI0039771E7A
MLYFRAPKRRDHLARPSALRRVISAFTVGLLAIIGLVAAPAAAVAATNAAIAIGGVTIEPADAKLTIGDSVTVSGTWDASTADPRPGDTFTIGLPDVFEFPAAVPFALNGPEGVVWGNCLTDPSTGIAECTLTDAVTERPELVAGTWQFQVEAVEVTTETEVVFDLNGTPVSVPLPGGGGIDDGIELPGEVSKAGQMNSNNWSMTWTIDIPGANLVAAGGDVAHITDTFGAGHVLCDPTGFRVQTVRGDTVVDVTELVESAPVAGEAGFRIALNAPRGGFNADVTYRLTYETCTPDGQIDPSGTTYENSMQIEGWGEAGQGIGTVTNRPWHLGLTKSGTVLGKGDRNGRIAWMVVVPGDQLFGKNSFTLTETLGEGHQLCTDTVSGLRVFERYGPSGQRDRDITNLLAVSNQTSSAQAFSGVYTIDDSDFAFKRSDYRYLVSYDTCVTSADLPEAGTVYANTVSIDGDATGGEAKVPGRSQGKKGKINGATVTIDGVEHMPQTTLDWNVTIPGEKVDGITGPLTLTDTLSSTQTVCAAGDSSDGLAARMNLAVTAHDQIKNGGLKSVDLTDATTVTVDGQQVTFEIAEPSLPMPQGGTSDAFTREYQYTLSYTTCTTSGGMDAPGTEYGNAIAGSGIEFSSSVTQKYSGSGTGTGVTRGSVALDKKLADTPGAALVPADTTFTVHVKEIDPKGATQNAYDLEVPLNGDPVGGLNARGTGWTVELSEPRFPTISGITWGAPKFLATEGLIPSDDGTTAVATLAPGTNISVTLQNTALLGSATVTKALAGPDAARELVDPKQSYRVTATIDTSALGDNVPAQPDRVLDITAGETVTMENLPVGAVVTFSEAKPGDDDVLTWSTPVISPNPITIEADHVVEPAAVTVTNTVDRTVGTFSIAKTVTGEQADNPAVPDEVTVTASWTQDGVDAEKTLTLPTDGTPVELGENLLIGTEVTLTETPLVDGSSIAWGAPVWSGTGVTVDGESAVVSITRDAEAQVQLQNHAATSVAGISLIKGLAGDAIGEVAPDTEFPVTATWTDAEGAEQSTQLTINTVEPTPLGVDLPAGTVVTITEGERPAFDTVVWESVTISGADVTDNGDGSAVIVVSDQQGDSTLVTVVNEATWAPGTFTLSKQVDGILLDNPDVPEVVTVTASWLDGDEPRQAEVALPTDGTVVPFGQDLPHGTLVTLAELPNDEGLAFAWSTPQWAGDDIVGNEDGTAALTIGAAKDAQVVVTNAVTPKLGSLIVTKALTGSGASLVEGTAFPVTATWTDLLGEPQQLDLEVRSGETTVIADLPLGTEVTLTEHSTELPVNARWHGATWSSDDVNVAFDDAEGDEVTIIVVGDGTAPATITVSNDIEKLPDLAVTGGPAITASVVVLAVLLMGVGILMLVLHRRRSA